MQIKTALTAACMYAATAWAETPPPVVTTMYPALCVGPEVLTETTKNFQELPFARGLSTSMGDAEAPPLSLVIFVNPETKSWTIVERVNAETYCIMAIGQKFEPVPKDIRDRADQENRSGQL